MSQTDVTNAFVTCAFVTFLVQSGNVKREGIRFGTTLITIGMRLLPPLGT